MKYRIGAVLMLSLMLSMLLMPLSVSADDCKCIIKERVQAPEDFSVGCWTIGEYAIPVLRIGDWWSSSNPFQRPFDGQWTGFARLCRAPCAP